MNLLEHEGKALLAAHGVAVPRGALWPDLPPTNGPFVIKAQIFGGKRGKQGGIRFAADASECRVAAEAMLGSFVGPHRVEQVYVEERLELERELYVAIVVDRERWCPLLVASRSGGMDVEDAPESAVLRLPLDPLLGLRPFTLRYATRWLGESGDTARLTADAIRGLYDTFAVADAALVEVNPLVITPDGHVLAADAKITLDDAAAFRHPERTIELREGTAFERRCAALGSVGIEMDGHVAIVVSGAGLMMATVDLLGAAGIRIRAAVDLAGLAFANAAQLADLLRNVIALSPGVIFVNAFFNLAFCDPLAQGIADAVRDQDFRGSVVVRLRGRNVEEAKAILRPMGFSVFEDLQDAVDRVIEGREVPSSRS